MGADIHAYVEGVLPDYSELVMTPNFGRSTPLFGLLAGVRGGDPVYEPKGLPDQLSWLVEVYAKDWGDDAHTHSWLSVLELVRVAEEFKRETRHKHPVLEATIAFMFEYRRASERDTRLVFWFDS